MTNGNPDGMTDGSARGMTNESPDEMPETGRVKLLRGIITGLAFAIILAAAVAIVLTARVTGSFPITPRQQVSGGAPAVGRQLFQKYGCGSCHTIAGVPMANGKVGPPLTDVGERAYIAGVLPNTPENLITWIQYPQRVLPGNDMPDLNVKLSDAKNMAAYLYSLR